MLGINILKTYYKKNIIKKYIINYKIIAHQLNADKGIYYLCGKCMLCSRGYNGGTVKVINSLKSKTGKIIKLKKK